MIEYDYKNRTLRYRRGPKVKVVHLSKDEATRYLNNFRHIHNILALEDLIKRHFELSEVTYNVLKTTTMITPLGSVKEVMMDIRNSIKEIIKETNGTDRPTIERIFNYLDEYVLSNLTSRVSSFKDFFIPSLEDYNEDNKGKRTYIDGKDCNKYYSTNMKSDGIVYTINSDKHHIVYIKNEDYNEPLISHLLMSPMFDPKKYSIAGINSREECVGMYFNQCIDYMLSNTDDVKEVFKGWLFRPLVKTNNKTDLITFNTDLSVYSSNDSLKTDIESIGVIQDQSYDVQYATQLNDQLYLSNVVTDSFIGASSRVIATGSINKTSIRGMTAPDKMVDKGSYEPSETIILNKKLSLNPTLNTIGKLSKGSRSDSKESRSLRLTRWCSIDHSDTDNDYFNNVNKYVIELNKYLVEDPIDDVINDLLTICYTHNIMIPQRVLESHKINIDDVIRLIKLDVTSPEISKLLIDDALEVPSNRDNIKNAIKSINKDLVNKSLQSNTDDNDELDKAIKNIVDMYGIEDINEVLQEESSNNTSTSTSTSTPVNESIENSIEDSNEEVIDIEPIGDSNEDPLDTSMKKSIKKVLDKYKSVSDEVFDKAYSIAKLTQQYESSKNSSKNYDDKKDMERKYNNELNDLSRSLTNDHKISYDDVLEFKTIGYDSYEGSEKSGMSEFSTLVAISTKLDTIIKLLSNNSASMSTPIDTSMDTSKKDSVDTDTNNDTNSSSTSNTTLDTSMKTPMEKPIETKYKTLINRLDDLYKERYGNKSGLVDAVNEFTNYMSNDFKHHVNGSLYEVLYSNKDMDSILQEMSQRDIEAIYMIGETLDVIDDTILTKDSNKGGIFSKLFSLIPGASTVYQIGKSLYNVAKPVVNRLVNKYNDAYTKKTGEVLDDSYYHHNNGLLDIDKVKDAMKSSKKMNLKEFRDLLNGN